MKKYFSVITVSLVLIMVGGLIMFRATANNVTDVDNMEDIMCNEKGLYVNKIRIKTDDTVIFKEDNEALFPMVTIFEALGAEIVFQETTENMQISYLGETYMCELLSLNFDFVLIKNIKNADSTDNRDYIQLNPMSADGAYCVMNDRIYLCQEAGKRLFEALGCTVEINSTKQILKITAN